MLHGEPGPRDLNVQFVRWSTHIPSQTGIAMTFQSWFSVEDEDAEKAYKEFRHWYNCRGEAMERSRTRV